MWRQRKIKMKNIFILLVISLFYSSASIAQNTDCFPDCDITWEQIRNMRNPLWTKVDITPECEEKIRIRRQEFEEEDSKQFTYLKNVACSYAAGWVENIDGECNAGGPPPCCKQQHWHKDPNAWETYKQKMRIVYEERWNEINEIYNSCMKQVNDEKEAQKIQKAANDKQFVTLTDEADKLEKDGKYDEAIEKLKQAKGLRPNTDSWIDGKVSSLEQKSKDKKKADEKKEDKKEEVKPADKKENAPPQKSAEALQMESKMLAHKHDDEFNKMMAESAHATMVAGITGIFDIWGLFQDEGKNHEYKNICSHFAIDLGINLISMPLVLNESTEYQNNIGVVYDTINKTTAENPVYTNLLVGIDYYPLISNKLSVGFHTKVMAGSSFEAMIGGGSVSQVGTFSLSSRASGTDFIFSGGAEVQIGPLLTSIDYTLKRWKYKYYLDSYDYDSGLGNTSNSDGSSSSSAFRYGVGLRLFKFKSGNNLDIMAMLENLSYYNNSGGLFNSPLVFKVRFWDQDLGKATLEYAPSYPVAGIPLYSDEALFKPYFSLNLALNINRFYEHSIDFNYDEITQSNERRGELAGFIDYSSLKTTAVTNSISGLGLNFKYKKVINSPLKENYIDFQMAGSGTMASNQNEYDEFETTRILYFSPDLRFTKKLFLIYILG